MASATLTTKNNSDVDVVLTLVDQGKGYAQYKSTARVLSQPLALTLQYKIGEPGAKGNDHLIVSLKDTRANTDGSLCTCIATLDVSVPRGDGWASGLTEDVLNELTHLLAGTTRTANRASVADGIAI